MGERKFENPQTVNLQSVLSASVAIQQLLAEREGEEQTRSDTVSVPLIQLKTTASLVLQ